MKLKQYREQLGYTQKKLAYRSGINYRSLQDYEQGVMSRIFRTFKF